MKLRYLFLAAGLLLLTAIASAQDAGDKEQELAELRAAIATLSSTLQADREKRDYAQAGLRKAELEVSAARKLLRKTSHEVSASRARQISLAAEQKEQRTALGHHRQELGRQLRAAYISGRQERIRLLLNQENPAALGRIMTYYGYLTEQRTALLQIVEQGLARLRRLDRSAEEETGRLVGLERRRQKELARLDKASQERAVVVASLERQISSDGRQLENMQNQERELEQLLNSLRRALEEFPMVVKDPFAGRKGSLAWPLRGRLINDFGQPRAGGRLSWQGVTLGAERGTEVRAVYHGRVAFADWLPGLGMLMVIEHGDGFMSLYGHNESLYREVGDWVEAGESIGIVGDSGGKLVPALYFEIRRGVKPLNPHHWLGRR
ncbi:MAG: peptidoglycan DD-metalloendopeptidase family protein [Gammaproteobacteria bacterium]|nr:peptidoglycan DD-metalloendopeptidase family protein [Gammaproteobacteria bacterium]